MTLHHAPLDPASDPCLIGPALLLSLGLTDPAPPTLAHGTPDTTRWVHAAEGKDGLEDDDFMDDDDEDEDDDVFGAIDDDDDDDHEADEDDEDEDDYLDEDDEDDEDDGLDEDEEAYFFGDDD